MSRWLEYASLFEEGVENPYFEARSAYQALSNVKSTLKEKSGKMIFLLGQPGSGKTYLLHHLLQDEELEHTPVLFDTPIASPRSFLTRLIKHMNEDIVSEELEVLKEQAETLYADKKILVMLDEAQLLNDETLEFIRILSDSRKFWIVCAMHEEEGREILGKSHFKSRPHKLIELGQLSPKELEMFINTQLILSQDKYVLDFHQKHAKRIYSLSKGNFRYLKKLIYTEFSLLHEAQELGMKKFEEPSKCLLNMAAIEIGLINV
jgi:ABC-type lipoprotein export system ATPase subunit